MTVFPTIYSGVIQPIFQNPVRKVFDIDGSATVEFDIERDLELNDEYERIVIIDVAVEEHLTGRRQNNSMEVHIHKYDYHMDLIKSADYFKPGLKYTAYVSILRKLIISTGNIRSIFIKPLKIMVHLVIYIMLQTSSINTILF